jgi:selenocysteine lyase/cysteine desulfurase
MITLPFQDFAGMNASLELLHEVGPAAVERLVRDLADTIVHWAERHPAVRLVTPADPAHRAGIVSLRPPDPPRVSHALKAAGVVHSLRENAIRLSPYFYNTAEEIQRALAIIEQPG